LSEDIATNSLVKPVNLVLHGKGILVLALDQLKAFLQLKVEESVFIDT
jgi:hypothetical protein